MAAEAVSTDSNPVVEAQALKFQHRGATNWRLEIDDFQVWRSEHTYICGPSGCGKTTLLQLLAGVLVPVSGRLQVLGQELSRGRHRDRRRAELMGFVFQSFNLVPYLGAIENVMLPCRFAKKRKERATADGVALQDEAGRLLEHLGIQAPLWTRKPSELSVGQQQRVAVARALIGRPPLIVCDEPTSALDPQSRDRFVDLLVSECQEAGSTALVVSHDPSIRHAFRNSYDLAKGAETTVLRRAA
ncbi:MAG: ATP-binding cassette domain-containing protein [Myxococcota bacterium]